MSDSAGMNDHHDLFEGGESKSSSSQESGLCSTVSLIVYFVLLFSMNNIGFSVDASY